MTLPAPHAPRWLDELLGPEAAVLSERARELLAGDRPTDVDQVLRVVPDADRELARAVLVQEELRNRARPRFGSLADRMVLTREGLEQASRPAVAARRARQLNAAGIRTFRDLTCGIGVDSMAAARAGLAVRAVERDPDAAAVAEVNIRSVGPSVPVDVLVADATRLEADGATLPGAAAHPPPDQPPGENGAPATAGAETAWFVDPARRSGFRVDGTAVRNLDPESWQPPWSWVVDLAARRPAVVAKAAPGLPHDRLPSEASAQWVSVAGQLVETTVWWGRAAAGLVPRSAALLTPGDDPWTAAEHVLTGTRATRTAAAGPLGEWLLEPDPAVVRSHLIAELCDLVGGRLVSPGVAYVTAGARPEATFGRVDQIVDILPVQPRRLRGELRRRGVASVEIRTRGLGLRPDVVRRQLRLRSRGAHACLVMTRVAGRPAALLVTPA